MKSIVSRLAVFFSIFVLLGLIWQFIPSRNHSPDKGLYPVIGNAKKLKDSYEIWKAKATKNGAEKKVLIQLGYMKGLSSDFTEAHGQASIDLTNGALDVEVTGLDAEQDFDFWFVDNISGPGKSVKPEDGDKIVKVGKLKNSNGHLLLNRKLAAEQVRNFKLDLAVVTRSGENPADRGLLFGSPSLFQRLYYSELRGEFGNLGDRHTHVTTENILLTAPFSVIIPTPAYAVDGEVDELVAVGEGLFFDETFDGNGRTCGTCHPMENNLTIDPEFIATLPPDDPLFVAENQDDDLDLDDLENPTLMRQFGLILENVDGFDDLPHKFVMRGVPHTLALITSIEQAADSDFPGPADFGGLGQNTEAHPADMTGWSGDGAPGTGSLKAFATGAVTQHFTKSLNRVPGTDFRLPTDEELDAMEAFQLSLGRQADPILKADNTATPGLQLKDPNAIAGKAIFINGGGDPEHRGKCITCHVDGGANQLSGGVKRNRIVTTGIEDRDKPEIFEELQVPRDGGFGTLNRSPFGCSDAPSHDCGFGDSRFNTPPLIEAADTLPLFHNNTVDTLEDAIRTYNGDEFNDNPNNPVPRNPGNRILLSEPQIAQVGKFLRVINALDNIRSSVEFLKKAFVLVGIDQNDANKAIRVSTFDLNDAIEVLSDKGLHPNAVSQLMDAVALAEEAMDVNNSNAKKSKIRQSVKKAVQAQNKMCTFALDSVLCEAEEL